MAVEGYVAPVFLLLVVLGVFAAERLLGGGDGAGAAVKAEGREACPVSCGLAVAAVTDDYLMAAVLVDMQRWGVGRPHVVGHDQGGEPGLEKEPVAGLRELEHYGQGWQRA